MWDEPYSHDRSIVAMYSNVMPRPILIVAHPGHELRLFGWMQENRPLLCILTDGSGGLSASRVHYSAALAEHCGAARGPVFGPLPDRAWYAAILGANAAPFLEAAASIVRAAEPGAPVVADPVEGYNPMHDLAAALADSVASRTGGQRLTYPLMAPLGQGAPLPLDGATLARKQAAIDAYTPLADEVQALLRADPQALRDERVLPACFDWPATMDPPAAYERIGAERTAAGRYGQTIRYARHVRPLALALRAAVPA
jgi:hypothetical protein